MVDEVILTCGTSHLGIDIEEPGLAVFGAQAEIVAELVLDADAEHGPGTLLDEIVELYADQGPPAAPWAG